MSDIKKMVDDAVLDSMVEKDGADSIDAGALSETLTKVIETAVADVQKAAPDLSGLTADEFAHYKKLNDEEGAAFLAKSAEERAAELTKKADDDEVLKVDGAEIRKSDVGDAMFAFAKAQAARADKAEQEMKGEMEKRMDAEFAKRAEDEYPNLPGEPMTKGKALRAVEEMDEGTAETIKSMLKSANADNDKLMKEIGTGADPKGNGNTAFAKLDAMAKEIRKKEPSLDYYAAYAKAEELNPELRDAAINGE